MLRLKKMTGEKKLSIRNLMSLWLRSERIKAIDLPELTVILVSLHVLQRLCMLIFEKH